jgi:valyl-tRNA synthetase
MPFLTEELWHAMGYCDASDSIMRAPWPQPYAAAERTAWGLTPEATAYVDAKHELIGAGRALRSEYGIAPGKPVRFVVQACDLETSHRLTRDRVALHALLRAETVEIRAGGEAPRGMPGSVGKLGAIFLPLAGLVDIPAEVRRVAGEVEKARQFLKGVEAKLGNPGFTAKAPPAVIAQQSARRDELQTAIERLERLARTLLAAE